MLLQDCYNEMARRVGLNASLTADKARIKAALENVLKAMYRKCRFIALKDFSSFATVDGTYLYYLDPRAMKIQNMRIVDSDGADQTLTSIPLETFRKEYPVVDTTDEDQPDYYVVRRKIWVTAQPTVASRISIVSSSGSDITNYYVVVRGIASGVETTERITLTGTTPALTTASFTALTSITKDATNGTVTATSNSGAVTNISLSAAESEKSYWEIQLHKVPDAVYTVYYDFRVIPWVFALDEDLVPIEAVYQDAVYDLTEAELLRLQGNQSWTNVSAIAQAKFEQIVDDATYAVEDEDLRAGLIEIDDSEFGNRWD